MAVERRCGGGGQLPRGRWSGMAVAIRRPIKRAKAVLFEKWITSASTLVRCSRFSRRIQEFEIFKFEFFLCSFKIAVVEVNHYTEKS